MTTFDYLFHYILINKKKRTSFVKKKKKSSVHGALSTGLGTPLIAAADETEAYDSADNEAAKANAICMRGRDIYKENKKYWDSHAVEELEDKASKGCYASIYLLSGIE